MGYNWSHKYYSVSLQMCDFDKKIKSRYQRRDSIFNNGISQIRYLHRKECKLVDIYHPPKNQFKMVEWSQQNGN